MGRPPQRIELRPADIPYVITQGTFLIGRWGNYLIADRVQHFSPSLEDAGHVQLPSDIHSAGASTAAVASSGSHNRLDPVG
jgi:hypothetical protein